MDKLTRFNTETSGTVSISSAGGNSLDDVISKLEGLLNEAKLLRAGHEEWTWGNLVEESEIDLEDLNLKLEGE